MNLLASLRKGLNHGTNVFGAVLGFATIFAAHVPSSLAAAENAVAMGASVTFIASADGSPAPIFQWRKNGTPIPGATTQTLSLTAVSLDDAAIYQVVATNEVGSAVSPDEV